MRKTPLAATLSRAALQRMTQRDKTDAVQEATITIEPLSEGPLKGKSIRCLHCEKEAVFLVGFGRHDVGSGAFCEEHTPKPGSYCEFGI